MARKVFGTRWVFEAFEDLAGFQEKPMFGCLAAYIDGRLMLLLAESSGGREYRGRSYPFDLWNGVLIATDGTRHPALLADHPSLVPHPILPKWLYLPMDDPAFEDIASSLGRYVARRDERIGVDPQGKKSGKKRGKAGARKARKEAKAAVSGKLPHPKQRR